MTAPLFGSPLGLAPRFRVQPTPTPEEILIGLLAGKAECGLFDMREATPVSGKVRVLNKSGGLSFYEAPDASNNPTLDATNGTYFNGNNSTLGGDPSITTADVVSIYILVKKDADDAGPGHILNAFTVYEDGSGSGMAINFTVEGSVRGSYNSLHDVLDDGAWHIMSVTGASPNFGAGLSLGRGIDSMKGYIKAVVIINEASFTAPGLTAVRTAAANYMASIF